MRANHLHSLEQMSAGNWGPFLASEHAFPVHLSSRGGGRSQRIFEEALRLQASGLLDRAIAQYLRVLRLRPGYAEAHNNLAAALAAKGHLDEAIAHYRQAIRCKADYFEACSNLGAVLAAQGRFEEAIIAYNHALALKPRNAGVRYNLAIALTAQNRLDEAALQYKAAIALNPNSADAYNNLANLLVEQNRPANAMVLYQRAIALDPRHAEAWNNLGNTLRDLGRFEEALAHYDRAIAIRPHFPEAHYHRAGVKRFRPEDGELTALETLAQRGDLPAAGAPYIHFALAKAHEDWGNFARAFNHLLIGNQLKRTQISYDERGVADLFQRITSVFSGEIFDRSGGHGDPSAAPVFIVGMPRSGGTLVHQILAGHPGIHGAGERRDLEASLNSAIAGGGLAQFPACVRALDRATLNRIGRDYLSRLRGFSDGRLMVVDKMPHNFLYLGLIRLILPNARIIHTVRDPIDTCVSCYSQLFASGQHFSYELGELGRYYRRYQDLMDHWRAVLPEQTILHVAYEDIVEDIEREARRLVAFCGLAWDDRCMNFRTAGQSVRTASAVQVRQPIFTSSVGRWRNYQFGIGKLLAELVPGRLAAHNSM